MPAMSMRRVLRSMTKSTRWRTKPPMVSKLDAEEVRRGDSAPVRLEECLAGHRFSPQGSRLDAPLLENALGGAASEVQAEVLEGAAKASVAPAGVSRGE